MTIDLDKIRHEVEKIVKTGPSMVTMGQLPFTPRAKKVLELSMEEASQLGHNYIGTEHLLLGLIRENEGIAAQVLMNLGRQARGGPRGGPRVPRRLENSRRRGEREQRVGEQRGSGGRWPVELGLRAAPQGNSKSKTPALDSFGRDLTELAREGKLDP
jgi:ATP-dependent Clp protease ATP-binding subunit ClpC